MTTHAETDSALSWAPASVTTDLERKFLQDAELVAEIAANRADPSRMRMRDRTHAPRS